MYEHTLFIVFTLVWIGLYLKDRPGKCRRLLTHNALIRTIQLLTFFKASVRNGMQSEHTYSYNYIV